MAAGALRVPALPLQGVQVVELKAALRVSAAQGAQVMAPVGASRVQAVPRGHGKHPGAAPLTKPGAQHVAHPGAENSPSEQGRQEVEKAAPTPPCHVPAGQGVHSGSEAPEEKVPPGQGWQEDAPKARATDPAGQGRQEDSPSAEANVPALQGRHWLGAAENVPRGHRLPSTQLM